MKRIAMIVTVVALVIVLATIALGVLGIWFGDPRYGNLAALGTVLSVLAILAASLSWVGATA